MRLWPGLLGVITLCCLGLLLFYKCTEPVRRIRDAKSRHEMVNYSGDGKFRDAGPEASIYRFQLQLEPIDLSSAEEQVFELQGLPRAHFQLHLEVAHRASEEVDPEWATAPVSATIRSGKKKLFGHRAPLSKWKGYPRIRLYPAVGFAAQPDQRYQIIISVTDPAPESPRARLQVLGGGWNDPQTNALYR